MTRSRTLYLAQIWIKFAALAVCAFVALGGHYPPAHAQRGATREVDVIPVMTLKDSQQDDAITSLKEHVAGLDARVSKQWDVGNANSTAIAGMQGENRVWFAILGLLSSGSIVLTVTSSRKRSES